MLLQAWTINGNSIINKDRHHMAKARKIQLKL